MYGATTYSHTTYGGEFHIQAVLLFSLAKSTINASSRPVTLQPSGFATLPIAKSSVTGTSFPVTIQPNGSVELALSKSQVNAIAVPVTISPDGSVTLALSKSFITVSAYPIEYTPTSSVVFALASSSLQASATPLIVTATGSVNFQLSKSTVLAEAYPILERVTWKIAQSQARSVGKYIALNPAGEVVFSLAISQVNAQANAIDVNYKPIIVYPDLLIDRSSDKLSCEIDLNNPHAGQSILRIFRLNETVGEYVFLEDIDISTLPHNDTGLDANTIYAYKAKYILEGNKAGSPITVEGNSSDIRTSIGNNRTI